MLDIVEKTTTNIQTSANSTHKNTAELSVSQNKNINTEVKMIATLTIPVDGTNAMLVMTAVH